MRVNIEFGDKLLFSCGTFYEISENSLRFVTFQNAIFLSVYVLVAVTGFEDKSGEGCTVCCVGSLLADGWEV